ncbi:MAG: type II secretion system secretin GspD [Phenylobacterium sp.]
MRRLAALILATAAIGLAAPAPGARAQSGQVLNMQDADIRVFVQEVARATGMTFVLDPQVQGTVNVSSQEPLSRNEMFEVMLSTLRANGLVAVPSGPRTYRIEPAGGGGAGVTRAVGTGAGFATQVFRLKTLDAKNASETLKPLISAQGAILPSQGGNLLIVADYADNLRRVRNLLAQVDQYTGSMEIVALHSTSANEVAGIVNELLKGAGETPGAPNRLVSIVVVESSNSLILKGDPQTLELLLPIIADLDRRAEAAGDVRVVRLQYANAEMLMPVLQQLVGQTPTPGSSGPPPAAAHSGTGATEVMPTTVEPPMNVAPQAPVTPARRATIARYPGANAIIIAADPETQRMLAEVIRQLDVRQQQVLVEAIVVEVSDEAAKRLGVQFAIAGINGSPIPFLATSYSNALPNLNALLAAAGAKGRIPENSTTAELLRGNAASSILNANGVNTGGAGQFGNDALFAMIINAVQSDTASNVLSTPSLMTLDNQAATLLAGQEVPVTTGEVLGDSNSNPFRTVQRQNVGVQLEVKPQINAGGTITLFLRQEVSSVAGPVRVNSEDLIFNKREISTTVNVDDGEIVVLGGLLDANERIQVEKTPLLGDIPGVGGLFRSTSKRRTKTNLMVFIRPTIVRDTADARALTGPRFGFMARQQPRHNGQAESDLEALVRHYMGATPPNQLPPLPAQAAPTAASSAAGQVPAQPNTGAPAPAPGPRTAPPP